MIQTILCDPTTGLGEVVTTYVGLSAPPLRANEVVCTAAQAANPGQWVYAPGANGASATLVAATAAQLAKPVAVLAPQLVTAAQAASGAITKQIAATETHLAGYASAANMAQVAGGVPANDPAKSAFAALATAIGMTPAALATLVLAMDAASVQNLAILATLEAAAAKAQSAADLSNALSAFETSVASFVSQLNSAGLSVAITAPSAITIVGINA